MSETTIEEFIQTRLNEPGGEAVRWLLAEIGYYYNHTGEPDSTWALLKRKTAAIWSSHPEFKSEWAI